VIGLILVIEMLNLRAIMTGPQMGEIPREEVINNLPRSSNDP
jgi:hypothetical protein